MRKATPVREDNATGASQTRRYLPKIVRVEYHETYNTGNYTAQRIGLVADVQEGETHQQVFSALRKECFYLSKQGQKLIKQAHAIIASDNMPPAKIAWAHAVMELRETRPFEECGRHYQASSEDYD
jgi:hypothetical protein